MNLRSLNPFRKPAPPYPRGLAPEVPPTPLVETVRQEVAARGPLPEGVHERAVELFAETPEPSTYIPGLEACWANHPAPEPEQPEKSDQWIRDFGSSTDVLRKLDVDAHSYLDVRGGDTRCEGKIRKARDRFKGSLRAVHTLLARGYCLTDSSRNEQPSSQLAALEIVAAACEGMYTQKQVDAEIAEVREEHELAVAAWDQEKAQVAAAAHEEGRLQGRGEGYKRAESFAAEVAAARENEQAQFSREICQGISVLLNKGSWVVGQAGPRRDVRDAVGKLIAAAREEGRAIRAAVSAANQSLLERVFELERELAALRQQPGSEAVRELCEALDVCQANEPHQCDCFRCERVRDALAAIRGSAVTPPLVPHPALVAVVEAAIAFRAWWGAAYLIEPLAVTLRDRVDALLAVPDWRRGVVREPVMSAGKEDNTMGVTLELIEDKECTSSLRYSICCGIDGTEDEDGIGTAVWIGPYKRVRAAKTLGEIQKLLDTLGIPAVLANKEGSE